MPNGTNQTPFDSALQELRLNNTNPVMLQLLRENAAQITDPAYLLSLTNYSLQEAVAGNNAADLLQFLQNNRAQITDPAQIAQLDRILNPPSPTAGLPTGTPTVTIAPRSRLRRAAPWAAGVLLAAGIGVGVYNLWNNGYLSGIPGVTQPTLTLAQLVVQATPLKTEFDKYASELDQEHKRWFASDTDRYVRRAVRTADRAITQNLDDVLHQNDPTQKTFTQLKNGLLDGELERLVPGYVELKTDFEKYNSTRVKVKTANPTVTDEIKIEDLVKADLAAFYDVTKKNHDLFAKLQRTWQNEFSDQDRFVARKVQWFEDLRLTPRNRLEAQLSRNSWSYAEETAEEIGKIFDAAQETKARNRISGDRLEYSATQRFDFWNFNKGLGGDQRREAEEALKTAYELIDKAKTVDADHASLYDTVRAGFKTAERSFRVSEFKRDIDNLYSALDQDTLGRNVDVLAQAKDLVDQINATDFEQANKDELSNFHTKISTRYWNRRFDREMLKASELAQNGKWDAAYWHTVAAVATQLNGSPSGLDLLAKVCTTLNIEGNDYTPKQSQAILEELLKETVDPNSNVGQALAIYKNDWKNRTATAYESRETKARKQLEILQPQFDAKLADLKVAEKDPTRASDVAALRTAVGDLENQINPLKEELNYESNIRFSQNVEKVVNSTLGVRVRIVYDAGKTVYGLGKGLVNLIRAPFAKSVTVKDAGNAFKDAGSSLLDVPDAALEPVRFAKGAVLGSAEQIPYAGKAFGYIRDVTPLQDPWAENNSNSRLGNPFGANNGPLDGYRWIEAHHGRAYANAAVIGSVVSDAAIGYALQQALEGGHKTGKGPTSKAPKGLSGGETRGPGIVPSNP